MNEESKTTAVPQGLPPVAPEQPAPAAGPGKGVPEKGPPAALAGQNPREPGAPAEKKPGGSSRSRRRRRKRSRAKNRAAQAAVPKTAPPPNQPAQPLLPPKSDMPVPAAEPEHPAAVTEQPEPALPAEPAETAGSAGDTESAEPAENACPAGDVEPVEPAETAGPAGKAEPPAWPAEQEPDEEGEPPAPPGGPEPPEPGQEPAPPEEPQPDAAELARRAEISRTAQMSIQQILAGVEEAGEAAPADSPEPETEGEPEALPLPLRIRGWAVGLLAGMARWLLLVVVLIALIAGVGLAWLYSRATPDMIPELAVTFDGQTLETASYHWQVPVVGNQIKRTYSDTIHHDPIVLEQVVDTSRPTLTVSPSGYTSQLTVTNADGDEVFSGTAMAFRNFSFTDNGEYTAELTIGTDQGGGQNVSVTGSQTYLFRFTVGIRPAVRINSRSAKQGSVTAVWVTDTRTGEAPTMQSPLGECSFFSWKDGWVAFLPIPLDTQPGGYTITVRADGYTEELDLNVTQADYGFRDVSSRSQRAAPYVGPEDTPAQVQALLGADDSRPAWTEDGFVQPFLRSVGTILAYGAPEYVGRNTTERTADIDNGTARVAENTLVETRRGDAMISPADGQVLLAENLGGNAGNTIVIDHGAGVKSIFYGLGSLQVEAGDRVVQGQTIATTRDRTIVEVRVGTVAVEPLTVLRGECDALNLS